MAEPNPVSIPTQLYCSITADGVLSVWDTPQSRQRGVQPDESMFELELTHEQRTLMHTANQIAQRRYTQIMEALRG